MTYIIGLRQLADFIERSAHFDQGNGNACTLGHAFRLVKQAHPDAYSENEGVHGHMRRAASMLGISREEALNIWTNNYPNRDWDSPMSTKAVAIEHLRQLADKYEPAEPIDAKPKAPESPLAAPPAPMARIERELVPA